MKPFLSLIVPFSPQVLLLAGQGLITGILMCLVLQFNTHHEQTHPAVMLSWLLYLKATAAPLASSILGRGVVLQESLGFPRLWIFQQFSAFTPPGSSSQREDVGGGALAPFLSWKSYWLTFVGHPPRARCCSKHFTYINSFHRHNNPMMKVYVSCLIFMWKNNTPTTEMLSVLCEVVYLEGG